MHGEKPYVYRDPVQQPIAPPYASFLKHKSRAQTGDVNEIVKTMKHALNTNSDESTSSTCTPNTSTAEVIETLDSGTVLDAAVADTSKNDSASPSKISVFKGADNAQDYIEKVTKERAKLSDEKFASPLQTISDITPEEVSSQAVKEEQQNYRNLAQLLLHQQIVKSVGVSKEIPFSDESDFLKVVKDALFGGIPLDSHALLTALDKCFDKENTKELVLRCVCNEDDSDVEEDH